MDDIEMRDRDQENGKNDQNDIELVDFKSEINENNPQVVDSEIEGNIEIFDEMKYGDVNEDSNDDSDEGEEVQITLFSSCFKNKKSEKMGKQKRRERKKMVNTVLENEIGEFSTVITTKKNSSKKYRCLCWDNFVDLIFMPCLNYRKPIPIFLVLLGLFVACLGLSMDLTVSHMRAASLAIDNHLKGRDINLILRLLVWFSWSLLFIGTGSLIVFILSDKAAGSGMGLVKSTLTGANIPGALSFRTLLAKVLGMVSVLCGGLFTGKKGSFVHTTVMVANLGIQFPVFSKIRNTPALKRQVFLASMAGSVAVAFGAPIGGALFAIETTPTLYKVRDFWFALCVTLPGAMLYRLLWHVSVDGYPSVGPIIQNNKLSSPNFYFSEFFIYVFLGILYGVLGALHTTFVTFCVRNVKKRINRFVWVLVVCICTGILTFPGWWGDWLMKLPLRGLRELLSEEQLTWTVNGSVIGALSIFVASRFFLSLITMCTMVPAGGYLACIVIGASSGRLIGEILSRMKWFTHLHPGLFAIVGASGFGTGVYHIASLIVVMLEWSGDTQHVIPALLVCFISLSISKKLQLSFWDKMIYDTKLPYLPELKSDEYTAKDLAEKKSYYVTPNSTLDELADILQNSAYNLYPVVNDHENKALTGKIGWLELQTFFLKKYNYTFQENKDTISDEVHLTAIEMDKNHTINLNDKVMFDKTLETNKSKIEDRKKYVPHITYNEPEFITEPIPWIRVSSETPLEDIHTLFISLYLKTLFVVDTQGSLTGVIIRESLAKFERERLTTVCIPKYKDI